MQMSLIPNRVKYLLPWSIAKHTATSRAVASAQSDDCYGMPITHSSLACVATRTEHVRSLLRTILERQHRASRCARSVTWLVSRDCCSADIDRAVVGDPLPTGPCA